MSKDAHNGDKNITEDLKINLSAGDNDIKYYECDGGNCIFEIVENNQQPAEQPAAENHSQAEDQKVKNEAVPAKKVKEEKPVKKEKEPVSGKIYVKSIIDIGRKEPLAGVKINIYRINGLSPVLIKSKITDENGEVTFSNLEEGSYRIIEIINKEVFEKPKYINWNEITIDKTNQRQKILIFNRIKKNK